MPEEPRRFNATQSCAATCAICRWESLSFGVLPGGGRLVCGNCRRPTARRVDFRDLPIERSEAQVIEELARASGLKEPQRLAKSGKGA